jgi:hypothetical protein
VGMRSANRPIGLRWLCPLRPANQAIGAPFATPLHLPINAIPHHPTPDLRASALRASLHPIVIHHKPAADVLNNRTGVFKSHPLIPLDRLRIVFIHGQPER